MGLTLLKVLFLDDNYNRRTAASRRFQGDELIAVDTAREAIRYLENNAPFDYVSLDHDLLGPNPVDSHTTDSGMEVVRWIAVHQPAIRTVNVHSWNDKGAEKMVAVLDVFRYNVERRLFGDNGFVDEEQGK